MNLNMSLSEFEIEMLNKLMHTQAFVEYALLDKELRMLIDKEKDSLVAKGMTTDSDFTTFENTTVHNIKSFLKHNEFLGEREGHIFFINEKGGQLMHQGSLQKYIDWERAREAALMEDLHNIETQGYLKKDQTFTPAAKPPDKDFNYRILWYVLILAAIFGLWWYSKSSHM